MLVEYENAMRVFKSQRGLTPKQIIRDFELYKDDTLTFIDHALYIRHRGEYQPLNIKIYNLPYMSVEYYDKDEMYVEAITDRQTLIIKNYEYSLCKLLITNLLKKILPHSDAFDKRYDIYIHNLLVYCPIGCEDSLKEASGKYTDKSDCDHSLYHKSICPCDNDYLHEKEVDLPDTMSNVLADYSQNTQYISDTIVSHTHWEHFPTDMAGKGLLTAIETVNDFFTIKSKIHILYTFPVSEKYARRRSVLENGYSGCQHVYDSLFPRTVSRWLNNNDSDDGSESDDGDMDPEIKKQWTIRPHQGILADLDYKNMFNEQIELYDRYMT